MSGQINERFEQVESDLGEVKETVERIDRRTQNQVDAVYEHVSDLEKRVTRLEAKVSLKTIRDSNEALRCFYRGAFRMENQSCGLARMRDRLWQGCPWPRPGNREAAAHHSLP